MEKRKCYITESDIKKLVEKSVIGLLRESNYNDTERPSVYVGTYGKYNAGSLKGEWINLDDFDSKEEFYEYCHELHSDERDPEFMFQDWENIPDEFIGESWIDDEFWDFLSIDEPYDVKLAVANAVGDAKEAMSVLEGGDYTIHYGCSSVEDVAYEYIDEGIMPSNPEYYFDYEHFGRECSWDGPTSEDYESIYEEFGVDEDDDEALGEAIVEQLYGGIENMDNKTIETYMDVKALARDMDMEYNFIVAECNGEDCVIEIY